MLYLYRNKYSREKFYFDSVRLKAYKYNDERMSTCRYVDMREKNMITPYEQYGLVAKTDNLMVITRRRMIAVWYMGYSYEFTYDDGIYLNDTLVSGIYDIQYRNVPVEYLFIDTKNVLHIGVGLKGGGIKIFPTGTCLYNEEKFNGECIRISIFKSRY